LHNRFLSVLLVALLAAPLLFGTKKPAV
jgi:hypothetical protein